MNLVDPVDGMTLVWIDYETASPVDLRKHGSYVYAENPETKVLCAAIKVNGHNFFWTMDKFNIGMPTNVVYVYGRDFLYQLFSDNVRMIAHNVDFERPISVLTLKLPEPKGGWRDTMDLTLMRGLPAGADAAGQYLLGMGKDVEGYALMMKTCKPVKKTGLMPVITDDIMRRYVLYNFRDVEIQYGINERFGVNIEPAWEQRVNNLHRDVNHRGVQVDIPFATTLKSFDNVFKDEARRQVEIDTKGAVKGVDLTRNAFLREYLAAPPRGLEMSNMRADTIAEILEADENGEIELSVEEYSVLTNRMIVSRASLAKVDGAMRRTCRDGRIRALVRYWGARTGRWSGSGGVQIQNMKRPDEDFDIEAAILAIENNDIETFKILCKDRRPYELLGSLVRGILIPRPGCKFVVGDFSQIEARVLLWMAEDWENLKEHIDYDEGRGPDIYCRFASFLYKKEVTKKTFPKERGIGKIGELACFSADTPILTNSGWKPIVHVTQEDLLWDGESWVKHEGVIAQGEKSCVTLEGVTVTPDHLLLVGPAWRPVWQVLGDSRLLKSAIETGRSSLRGLTEPLAETWSSTSAAAPAGKSPASAREISGPDSASLADAAGRGKSAPPSEGISLTPQSWGTARTVDAGFAGTTRCGGGAIARRTYPIGTTEPGESELLPHGTINPHSCGTSRLYRDGIIPLWIWTVKIIMGIIRSITSAYQRVLEICETHGSPRSSSMEGYGWLWGTFATSTARDSRTSALSLGKLDRERLPIRSSPISSTAGSCVVPTFDIKNAGPRNRYQAGPFIVHNCGYQGGVGAVDRFAYAGGVDLAAAGIAAKTIVDAWRAKHPRVVDMWHFCDDAFRRAIRTHDRSFKAARCEFQGYPNRVEIKLPSGRVLTYMNARLEPSKKAGWEESTVIAYDSAVKGRVKREEIYGGKIVENIDQAIARDLLADAMLRIAETGDDIVMHVHDEAVAEVPDEYAEEARDSMEAIMKVVPEWAVGLPVNAKPEIFTRYGK